MIKNLSSIEIKVGEKTYVFLCDNDSPIGEVHDALSKMKSQIVEIINKANESEQPIPSSEVL